MKTDLTDRGDSGFRGGGAAAELHAGRAAAQGHAGGGVAADTAPRRAYGKKLFIRAHRSVESTAEGRNYLHTVATALSHVSAATRELRSAKGDPALTLAADQSIAHLWLLPRLAAFRREWPGLSISLVVSDEEKACLAPQVDVAIIHGEGAWPGYNSTLLFGEEVFPVCSPDYRDAAGEWPGIGGSCA